MVLEEDWDSVGETKPERGRQIINLRLCCLKYVFSYDLLMLATFMVGKCEGKLILH